MLQKHVQRHLNGSMQSANLFAKNNSAMLKLLISKHSDTRKFARRILQATIYTDSEAQKFDRGFDF